MKHAIQLCTCCVLALFFFTACTEKSPVQTSYSIEHAGKTFVIDAANQTITNNDDVYAYSFSGNTTTITYPHGSTYFRTTSGNGWAGGWSDDYDETKYIPGGVLMDVLYRGRGDEKDSSGPSPFLAILLIAAGAFNAAKPRTAWYLGYGWRFKDAEPSELALGVERVVGVVVLIIGVIMLLASLQ